MNSQPYAPPAKYPVEVHPVREVSLFGTADHTFWNRRVGDEGLHATNFDGQALITICAAGMRFMGIRAQELSISLAVSERPESEKQDGYYLLHAFNSVRFFAWVERTLFRTPYFSADVRVDVDAPIGFSASIRDRELLGGTMGTGPRTQSARNEIWEGPVHLPNGKLFFAKLAGEAEIYPYTAADQIRIRPTARAPVLQALVDSRFTGKHWTVRANATHSKSKTQDRGR